MKNLNKLGVIFSTGVMSALVFAVAACGEDPPPANTGGSGGSGGGATAGGGAGGTTAGGGAGGKAGSGGGGAGGSGMSGGGAGGKAGSGGGGAGGGGAGGAAGGGSGGGGAGGGGGAPSAACMKLCMGADSIVTICAGEAGIDADLKMPAGCLSRCGEETDMSKVKCWQDHAINFKTMAGDHCKHAGGVGVCAEWPE